MEYEKLIIELIGRITSLEKRVSELENKDSRSSHKNIKNSRKYKNLSNFLNDSGLQEISLTFDKIEEILGFELPNSAKVHRPFWANTETHSIALSWLSVGYRTAQVNMENETVIFEKGNNFN